MKKILILLIVVLFYGCTSAGPYVTNISSDGKCNLIVEKNTVHMNGFTGTVSAGANPFTMTIRVCNPEKQ
jgi:uncharacterized protein YxeA